MKPKIQVEQMPDCSRNLSGVIDNHVPDFDELRVVIEAALESNFESVVVDVTDGPDLSKEPFNQCSSGFGKNMRIAEIGGPSNLFPLFHVDHQFNFNEIAEVCELPKAAMFGPGAGPWPEVGVNCEMVADVNLSSGKVSTRIAKINAADTKGYELTTTSQPKFSLMANLAVSEADKSQPVVHFKASVRKGAKNVTNTIRDGLAKHFGDKTVSMAGVFIMHEGKAKLHVMPHFPGCPFESTAEVDKWLKYFEMSAPLVCATVLHSHDPGRHLRLEHTHCYSSHGDGGHYHYDTTPETVSYEGWLAPAQRVYRIDEC